MKKSLNFSVLVTSLMAYLEWGTHQKMFLFEMERDILTKMVQSFSGVVHPFVLLPMLGQVLLIVTLFQREPSKNLSIIGTILISILLYFIFFIGLISLHLKIILFSLPFVIVSIYTFAYYKKIKQ